MLILDYCVREDVILKKKKKKKGREGDEEGDKTRERS